MTLSGKRILSLAVVAALCGTAAPAIAILLFGEFHRTQGRILGTTALLALSGLLALPAVILFDQRRCPGLARAVVAFTIAASALALAALWTNDPPQSLGKSVATGMVFTVALTQTAALAARRITRDSRLVRRLFAASLTLAFVFASMVSVAAWTEIGHGLYYRLLAATAVADVLTVALQPILARGRAAPAEVHRLRLLIEPGEERQFEVEAPSFAAAVAKAVAAAEDAGAHVRRIERVGRDDLDDIPEDEAPVTTLPFR